MKHYTMNERRERVEQHTPTTWYVRITQLGAVRATIVRTSPREYRVTVPDGFTYVPTTIYPSLPKATVAALHAVDAARATRGTNNPSGRPPHMLYRHWATDSLGKRHRYAAGPRLLTHCVVVRLRYIENWNEDFPQPPAKTIVEWETSLLGAENAAAHWRRLSQRIESIEIFPATRKAVRANPTRTIKS